MFQTELHLWLQSCDAAPFRVFMQAVSLLGEESFYALLLLTVIFAVERERGLVLAQVLLWTAIITSVLKDLFALPRPVDVDTRVVDIPGERQYPSPFTGRGATTFLGPLPDDVVSYWRGFPGLDHGLPSGHNSSAVAFWGAAAILFRQRWLTWVTFALLVLMPVSRMYLGRHFLADVILGLALGTLFVLVVATAHRWLATRTVPVLLRAAGLFLLPALAIVLLPAARSQAAILLGLNAGVMVAQRVLPWPAPSGYVRRALAALVGAGAFAGISLGIAAAIHALGIGELRGIRLLSTTAIPFLTIPTAVFLINLILPRKSLNRTP